MTVESKKMLEFSSVSQCQYVKVGLLFVTVFLDIPNFIHGAGQEYKEQV